MSYTTYGADGLRKKDWLFLVRTSWPGVFYAWDFDVQTQRSVWLVGLTNSQQAKMVAPGNMCSLALEGSQFRGRLADHAAGPRTNPTLTAGHSI